MDLHEEITELRQLLEDPSIPSSRPADRGEEKKIIKAAITKLEKEYDKMSDEFDNKFGKKYWGIF